MIIRDNDFVLGIGWIDRIDSWPGEKSRRRCPVCGSTNFGERATKTPRFRCVECKSAFDAPAAETVAVTQYLAHYENSFIPVETLIRKTEINSAYESFAVQQAIRRMNPRRLWEYLAQQLSLPANLISTDKKGRQAITGGYRSGFTKIRLGQQQFRAALLDLHGEVCAFMGPQPPAPLEAAHVRPFSDSHEHDPASGLLLRRDMHSLFDRLDIAVDVRDWRLWVSPTLFSYPELASLHDRPLQVAPLRRPRADEVMQHFALATARVR